MAARIIQLHRDVLDVVRDRYITSFMEGEDFFDLYMQIIRKYGVALTPFVNKNSYISEYMVFGFTEEEAEFFSTKISKLLPDQIDKITKVSNYKQFISILNEFKPTLAKAVIALQTYPDKKPQILELLYKAGFTDKTSKILFYKSGRPRTDMNAIIKSVPTLYIKEWETTKFSDPLIPDYNWLNKTFILENKILIPVIRYALGMERGLYYTESSKSFCGTFFYLENDSDIYIKSERTLVTPNKLTAYIYLYGKNNLLSYIEHDHNKYGNVTDDESDVQFPKWEKYLKDLYGINEEFKNGSNQFPKRDFSVFNLFSYGIEDTFDQPICNEARKQQFDIILLTTMTAHDRIISEVLATKGRNTVLEDLVRI